MQLLLLFLLLQFIVPYLLLSLQSGVFSFLLVVFSLFEQFRLHDIASELGN